MPAPMSMAFNSLFEMHYDAQRYVLGVWNVAFNSLFEMRYNWRYIMPVEIVLGAFNSLFEMHGLRGE